MQKRSKYLVCDKKPPPARQHQDGIHIRRYAYIKSKILYHLRAATASRTLVLAGCYFYVQNEKEMMFYGKQEKASEPSERLRNDPQTLREQEKPVLCTSTSYRIYSRWKTDYEKSTLLCVRLVRWICCIDSVQSRNI